MKRGFLFAGILVCVAMLTLGMQKWRKPPEKLYKVEQQAGVWEREFQIMGEVYQRIGYPLSYAEADSLRNYFSQTYLALYNQYTYQKHLADSLEGKKVVPNPEFEKPTTPTKKTAEKEKP